MNRILTADWHLTDDPHDEYRWGMFPWLKEKLRSITADPVYKQYAYPSCSLYVLGDLTDKIDYHSGALTNRVVDNVVALYRETGINEIVIVKGNSHDGLEHGYFKFLRHFDFIKYIDKPQVIQSGFKRIALLPHTKRPQHDWKRIDFSSVNYVFTHITVSGAKSETDFELEGSGGVDFLKGLRLAKLTGETRIFSGDVHVPQKVGEVEYVGAPYPVRFGDRFKGRVLVLGENGVRDDWYYPSIKRVSASVLSVRDFGKLWLRKGDQLKVVCILPKAERHDWPKHREEIVKWCSEKGVVLRGLELGARSRGLRLKERSSAISPAGSISPTRAISPTVALDLYARRTKPGAEVVERGEGLLKVALKPR